MASPIASVFLDQLVETLAGTSPGGTAEQRQTAARGALDALGPRDIVEAMLAARMIAAHHASMDGFRRAMDPELPGAEAVRLRNSAVAAARSFDAALRALEKRQAAAGAAKPAANAKPMRPPAPPPDAEPVPKPDTPSVSRPQYVPRDKAGNAIPLWRWEDMTPEQRRAAYSDPEDVDEHLLTDAGPAIGRPPTPG